MSVMNKPEAYRNALSALSTLQDCTKQDFPVGKIVQSPRGKGLATFKVVGYPDPISLDHANAVIGENAKSGKEQVVSISSII